MSRDKGPWREARRAWERLKGWDRDDRPVKPGHPDDGDAAVEALADIGLVRRLLEQAEMAAVRTARRHGKSWAEIATRLGVSRQSAWERWRDLDAGGLREPTAGDVAGKLQAAAAADLVMQAMSSQELQPRARERRRRSSVTVPDVTGMSLDDARGALIAVGLIAVGSDPDGPPLAAFGWPDGVVVDQSPESGAKVPPGSRVMLRLGRGGGSSGVREPRRPNPSWGRATEMSDEATG